MKKFLDNNLTSITNRHFKKTSKTGNKETVRTVSEPTIYDVIKAVKEEVKERPDDKGLKYAVAQLHFFGRKSGYTSPAGGFVSTITASCSKMFPYSRVASVLNTSLEKVSLKLDTNFLDKVAELVKEQDGYDEIINKLGFTDNSIKSVESRKYLKAMVNILEGADTVNNLMYEIEEVIQTEPTRISDTILDNKALNAYETHYDTLESLDFERNDARNAEFMQIIDFSTFPVNYESFGVRSAQYQLLDTLPEKQWKSYLSKMSGAGINVEYNESQDTFDVTSFKVKADDPKDTTKLEYEPASKSPSNIKKTKAPAEEGKKEKEVITKLEGQAKEAFTKIFNRTEQLRKLKDKQLEIQANLTAIKNSYTEEKEFIAAELEGYLKFAENTFKKLDLAEETAYALETQEGIILAAIKETSKITMPKNPEEQIIPADAQNILDRLKKMGKVTDELVAEVEKQINDENSLVKTIEHVTKTMYTWPPSQKDTDKIKGEVKQASPMDKFKSMLKGALDSAKKFFGLVDTKVDEFQNEFQELQAIMENY